MSLNQEFNFWSLAILKMRIWNVSPEEPNSMTADPPVRLTQLALAGYAQLAADTVLNKGNQGKVLSVIKNSIGQLDQSFREDSAAGRNRCVEVLLEIALNFL